MNRKISSKFLMLALAVGVFGVMSATTVWGADAPTSTQIDNVVPSFTTHTAESWTQAYTGSAVTNGRTESSATYPTNEGTDVTFSATANDTNNDQYYLIVCESAGVTTGNTSAPSCTGTQICVSSATDSDSEASCSKSTTGLSSETYNWYSYVCDANTSGLCSAASNTSQGGANAEAGTPGSEAGSPYHVNHIPTFTAGTIVDSSDGSIAPGDTVKFPNSADADTDTNGGQNTVNLYVCSGESDMGGVTTAFDYQANSCTGGTLLCSATGVDPSSADATCNDTTSIVSIPTAHASDYTVQYYLEDNHDFGAAVDSQDFTVIDVAPVLTSYTTTDTLTITAGGSDTLTRAVTFTDNNGDNDPTLVDMVFFENGSTTDACSADENDCYRFDDEDLSGAANCTVSDRSTAGTGKTATGTDASLSLSCDFEIYFNATASSDWEMSATVTDGTGDTNFADSSSDTEVAALAGIGVSEAGIAYGTVAVGGDSSVQTTTMENLGNQVLDVLLDGTNMSSGGNTIAAAQQHWHPSSSSFTYGTGDFALVTSASTGTETSGCLNRDMAVRNVHDTGTEDEAIYWRIRIPAAQESGSYTGTNTFATTASSSCTGTLN